MSSNSRLTARASTAAVLAMLCVVAGPAVASAEEPVAAPVSTSVEPAPAPVAAPAPEPAPVAAPAAAPAPAPAAAPVVAQAAPAPGDPCYPGACITNGTVRLGVNATGELNLTNAAEATGGRNDLGLQYVPTGNDGVVAGALAEGWGVADGATGTWGGANRSFGTSNLSVESFDVTPTTATSVVTVGDSSAPTFRVTHDFTPSVLSPNLYVIRVRIENLTDGTIEDVRYRRAMDWDAEPTAFSEVVTVVAADAAVVRGISDNGFASPNPLDEETYSQTNIIDRGPNDIGALFDFGFGSLASGGFIEFFLFYGAAATAQEAEDALALVGADTYSLAKPSAPVEVEGTPNTFMFGFSLLPEVLPEPDPDPDPVDPDPVDPDPVDPDPVDPGTDAPGGDGPDTGDAAGDDLEPVSATTPAAAGQVVSGDVVLPAAGASVDGQTAALGVALLLGGLGVLTLGRRRSAS